MADIWLRSSDGDNANAGTLKELPKATLVDALTAAGAGGNVYVSANHAETQAATMALVSPGTLASPTAVLCVADWGADTGSAAPTTLATTATVTTTGNNQLQMSGVVYSYGIVYRARVGGTGAIAFSMITSGSVCAIENGGIESGGSGSASINIGASRIDQSPLIKLIMINSGFRFAAVGNIVIVRTQFVWKGSTALLSGSSVPTTLLNIPSGIADVDIAACDLSAIAGTLVDVVAGGSSRIRFSRCQLHASVTIASGTISGNTRVEVDRCKSGAIEVPPIGLSPYSSSPGTATHTIAHFRTGGADDGEQVNAYSLDMTTDSTAKEFYNPLEITLGSRWVGPKSSISAATAQGIFTSTRAAPLATPVNLTTDTSDWTGAGTGTKQKIDHTLSSADTLTVYVASEVTLQNDEFWIEVSEPDQVAGLVTVKAFLAKPSTTVYVDPKIGVA